MRHPVLQNVVAFCRDTNLTAGILEKYEIGVLFREPTMCDATDKFGGLAASHRYLILSDSGNPRRLGALSAHPEWSLCVWQPGTVFKVIGRSDQRGYTQVTLLEVPDGALAELGTWARNTRERDYASWSDSLFAHALNLEPRPEHATRLWLDRLTNPLGMDDHGEFFQLLTPGQ